MNSGVGLPRSFKRGWAGSVFRAIAKWRVKYGSCLVFLWIWQFSHFVDLLKESNSQKGGAWHNGPPKYVPGHKARTSCFKISPVSVKLALRKSFPIGVNTFFLILYAPFLVIIISKSKITFNFFIKIKKFQLTLLELVQMFLKLVFCWICCVYWSQLILEYDYKTCLK